MILLFSTCPRLPGQTCVTERSFTKHQRWRRTSKVTVGWSRNNTRTLLPEYSVRIKDTNIKTVRFWSFIHTHLLFACIIRTVKMNRSNVGHYVAVARKFGADMWIQHNVPGGLYSKLSNLDRSSMRRVSNAHGFHFYFSSSHRQTVRSNYGWWSKSNVRRNPWS